MIDTKAFRSISYGLYLISSHADGELAGCVVNTFAQVTSKPLQVSVALNKENHTTDLVLKSGRYAAVCLSEHASMELIGTFGFHHSREVDKFESFSIKKDSQGLPFVAEQILARFSVSVSDTFDLGTHILFIGTVEEAEVLSTERPMTYAYYHEVKGGKTPPRASGYIAELDGDAASDASAQSGDGSVQKPGGSIAWRCTVCGHIEYVDELPDDFICPVCRAGRDKFERIEV